MTEGSGWTSRQRPRSQPTAAAGTQPTMAPRPAGLPTHLPLWLQVLSLSIWPLLEQFMNATVGFVDTALAGRLEPAALEAIGAAGYVVWLMGIMQGAVGVGSTAIIARAVGGGRLDEADAAVGQSMLLAAGWGVANLLLFFFAAPLVPMATSLEGRAAELCTLYLRLVALAAPLRAVLFIGAACLRGAGDMKSPVLIMAAINLTNIVVSILLVFPWSPIGGLGLVGVAVGTIAAWVVGGVAMVTLLLSGRRRIKLHARRLRPEPGMCRRLVRVGLPALAENGGHWLGNLVVIVMVGWLATAGLAERPMGSHIVAIRIEAFSFLLGFAFHVAAATAIGQYLGVGDEATAKRAGWLAWVFGASIMVVFGVLFMTIPESLTRIFTNEQPFLTVTPQLIFHAGWAQIGFATYLVLAGALRGAGDTRTTMMMTFGSTFLFRIPLAWLMGIHFELGLVGVWIALACELVFRGGLFLARFVHGGWTRIKV